jgi:phosphomannomutase/phosphoglucomutase
LLKRLFGTNGIRFIPKNFADLDFALKVAESIGTYFQRGEVLVGRDGRTTSPVLLGIVSSGLMSSGVDVAEAGLVPTPALQFCVKKLKFRGGVMVTASHNPPEYNGIKVVGANGVEIPRDEERKVESIYFEEKVRRAKWDEVGIIREETSIIRKYLEDIVSKVNAEKIRKRKFKIVMDLGNGAQCLAAPYVAEELGCKVITINSTIDGNFPGRGPEPTPDVLGTLSRTVLACKADFGVAYDGDGDRAIFCDERGKIIWGDQSGALLADYIASKRENITIVTPVSTSQVAEVIAERRGAKVIRTKVGSVDVSNTMIERNAIVGFEENGGFIYAPHIPVRDGAMATAMMLEFLSTTKRSLSEEISSRLPNFYQMKTKVQVERDRVDRIMEELDRRINEKVEKIDGLKVWLDNHTWVLIRPSGTEPIIRIFAESNSKASVKKAVERFLGLVRRLK